MKRLKDPIYGYISIDDDIISDIIDTAEFQRLRQIIQTSYAPLYASAVHNRFVHSIGVYYLGCIVSEAFVKSLETIPDIDKEEINRYIEIFKLACLLHDVGHAPFSHTGEGFYLDENSSRQKLHSKIIGMTEDKKLQDEIEKCDYSAAPHELMSIIVALKSFSAQFRDNKEKSFFARCISGYLYTEIDIASSFLNCMISMLNSPIIDVDKLDYLIRDAYITGFDTISIDYRRLLNSVMIIKNKDKNNCKLVFDKSAVSVIENVIFAHDAERKWIQNHPTVQYDSYILKYAIEKINSEYDIFNLESIGVEGKEIDKDLKIQLLSDGDIIFLMKNIDDDLIREYFVRKNRRHPLWKSESEYKACSKGMFTDDIYDVLDKKLDEFFKYLNYTNNSNKINACVLQKIEEDIKDCEKLLENSDIFPTDFLDSKRRNLKFAKCFEEFAKNQDMDFDFVIIRANQFNSGFSKIAFEKIEIFFPLLNKSYPFKEVTNVLSANKSQHDKFFYVFYRKKENQKRIDIKLLLKGLYDLAIEEL